jgi:hypothetical protein
MGQRESYAAVIDGTSQEILKGSDEAVAERRDMFHHFPMERLKQGDGSDDEGGKNNNISTDKNDFAA